MFLLSKDCKKRIEETTYNDINIIIPEVIVKKINKTLQDYPDKHNVYCVAIESSDKNIRCAIEDELNKCGWKIFWNTNKTKLFIYDIEENISNLMKSCYAKIY